MSASLDQLLVAIAILGAIGYFVRRTLVKRRKVCDSGCGCAATKELKAAPSQKR